MNLNTNHPLYANLVSLIGVNESNALVDLVTPARTFTVNSEASFVNTGLGRALRTVSNALAPKGATMGTALPLDSTSSQSYSVFIAFANFTNAQTNGATVTATMLGFTAGVKYLGLPTFRNSDKVLGLAPTTAASEPNSVFTTADLRDSLSHSVCTTTTSVSSKINAALYLDGAATAATITNELGGSAAVDMIGGSGTNGSIAADYVWVAVFNKVLTPTEISDLHASLGSNNTFSLIESTAPDATAPTLAGSLTVSNLTTNSYTLGWPAGADNIAVTGYEYSLDGGATYTDAGNVLSVNITGRSPGSTDAISVRDYDAAGNKSIPLTTNVTLNAAPTQGTLTTPVLKNNTGTVLASETGATVHVYQLTGELVVSKTAQSSDVNGVMTITDALIIPGNEYRIVLVLASGAEGMDKVTAT